MTKVVLNRMSTLVNGVTTLNGIITQIETAFDNTLSRDGDAPNQMAATLDMNSNRIINVAAPSAGTDACRYADLAVLSTGTSTSDHVTKRQFFSAVAALADMNLLYQAVSADANNAIWIEFQAARTTTKTGALALLAKTTFGWTDAQLDACFELAMTLAP